MLHQRQKLKKLMLYQWIQYGRKANIWPKFVLANNIEDIMALKKETFIQEECEISSWALKFWTIQMSISIAE